MSTFLDILQAHIVQEGARDVQGKELIIDIELVKDREKKTLAQEEATEARAKMLEKVVLIILGGVRKYTMRMQSCSNITNEQVDKVIGTFEKTLRQL